MARRITEAMHGKLDLLPAEGRGCAFRISLTRQEAT
jgi:signal transduction histidine kinase